VKKLGFPGLGSEIFTLRTETCPWGSQTWVNWQIVFLVSYNPVGVEEMGRSVPPASLEWERCRKPATMMQMGRKSWLVEE